MAASGAKVLQLRSVEYARTHGVRIHCRSSFEDGPGTVVLGEDETMEHPLITAVTHSTDEARITLLGVPDRPGAAACDLHARWPTPTCNVDMIIQNEPARARAATPRSRSRSRADDLRARRAGARAGQSRLGSRRGIDTDPEIGKVSIVGAGMRSHPGVAAKVFATLAEEDINIEMISTSPIKISCVIRSRTGPAGGDGAAQRVRAGGERDDPAPERTRVPPIGRGR